VQELQQGRWQQAEHDLQRLYGPKQSRSDCLDSPGHVVNDRTDQSIQAGCRKATCVACNRFFARRYRDAMCLTHPTHFIRLTGVHESWADSRSLMQDWFRRMRSTGQPVNFDYTVERNPQNTGYHIHGWYYGSPNLSSSDLHTHARSAGLVHAHVRSVTYRGNFAYPLKAATWNADSMADFSRINGSHRHHPTRTFWRDPRTNVTYPSMDAAATAWRLLTRHQQKDIWTFKPQWRNPPDFVTPSVATRFRAANDDEYALG